jgi:TusA-related sulfurtransferase
VDAKKIFRDKIKYAYQNLPEPIKKAIPLEKDDACEMIFSNNSGIYVGTSMRSGTLQYLHVSEYGWICAHCPQKAMEIKAGAMETVHEGGIIIVESTAEGAMGDFYEMCQSALQKHGKNLSIMDYRIHFYPWHEKTENQTDPTYIEIPDKINDYLDGIERIYSKKIELPQRAWYAAKRKTLKYLIYKEHPSTQEEAFQASVEGAYYIEEIAAMREQGRITNVPYLKDYAVHTICDLGLGYAMPWIFFQVVGVEVHLIDSFCLNKKDDVFKGIEYYKRMLNEYREKKGYNYGLNFCPFDIEKGELGTGETLYKTALKLGLKFTKLEREYRVIDGIQRLINVFPRFWIDATNCKQVVDAWSSYHREWIPNLGVYSDQPAHDASSHFADAGRYLSMIIEKGLIRSSGFSGSGMSVADVRRLRAEFEAA